MKDNTTKRCPQCGNTHLVRLMSLDKKLCPHCPGLEINWTLDPGQKPLR